MTSTLAPIPQDPPIVEATATAAMGSSSEVTAVQATLYDVMSVEEVRQQAGKEPAIFFKGHLLCDAETALTRLLGRFELLGYTPLIRHQGDRDLVIAYAEVFSPTKSRLWVPVALFLATVLTTTIEAGPSRGRSLERGYFYFGDEVSTKRGIHLFYLTEINGAATHDAMRVLPSEPQGRSQFGRRQRL